jgi:hypothetical protein
MGVSRLGQDLGTGDANVNFLKVFAGEVLATFQEANKFMPLIMSRTISQGKSAAFPVIGTASAHWHTAGESVITDQAAAGSGDPADPAAADYLSQIKVTEREIFIDDVLVSSVLVDDLDAMKSHWDHRSEYSSAIGRALAKEADEHILASIYAGASATANIPGVTAGGFVKTDSDADTNVNNLIDAAFEIAETFDDNDVPAEDRYFAVKPTQYYLLANDGKDLVNRDYGGEGNGSYSGGTVLKVAGMTIVKTNNFGSGDLTSTHDTGAKQDLFGDNTGYNGNWTGVHALAFHRSAVGCVKMADLQVMSEYQLERLSNLLLAKYAMGHNYLRPECCAVVKES